MGIYKRLTIIFLLIIAFGISRAADDTFIASKATEAPVIDGIGNEVFWTDAEWYPLNQVWLPYGDVIEATDFTGRFKLSWNENRLLLLVEIVDDSLNDGHADPFVNYWDDDCVEVFLDENHSGGDYQNTFKAFAYHVSTTFDVVDPWTNVLLNDHIQTAMTQHDSLYTWELSIKVFNDKYTKTGVNIPDTLSNNKELGFSLAYCDNDRSPQRENFIGSKYLPKLNSNDSYMNSSWFGTLTLKDPSVTGTKQILNKSLNCKIFPNPAGNLVYYQITDNKNEAIEARIINLNGQILYREKKESDAGIGNISLPGLEKGIYILELINGNTTYSNKILVE